MQRAAALISAARRSDVLVHVQPDGAREQGGSDGSSKPVLGRMDAPRRVPGSGAQAGLTVIDRWHQPII